MREGERERKKERRVMLMNHENLERMKKLKEHALRKDLLKVLRECPLL